MTSTESHVDPALTETEQVAALEAELAALDVEIGEVNAARLHRDATLKNATQLQRDTVAAEETIEPLRHDVDELQAAVHDCGDLSVLEAQVEALEAKAASQVLKEHWSATVQAEDLEALAQKQDFKTPVDEFLQQLTVLDEHHADQCARMQELTDKLATVRAQAGMSTADTKANIDAELKRDLARLPALRRKLRQALSEQNFHMKRGTHVKRSNVPLNPRDQELQLAMQREAYDKRCTQIVELDGDIESIRREVVSLQTDRNHVLSGGKAKRAELEEQLEDIQEQLEEVEWERRVLAKEQEDLRKLRADILQAQQSVKTTLKANHLRA